MGTNAEENGTVHNDQQQDNSYEGASMQSSGLPNSFIIAGSRLPMNQVAEITSNTAPFEAVVNIQSKRSLQDERQGSPAVVVNRLVPSDNSEAER
jgi:hypothetical protein